MSLNLIIQLIGRGRMYFAPATLAVYPIIARNIKQQFNKILFVMLLVSFTIYMFVSFFYSATYQEHFGIYRTILAAPQWQ
jgi:putative effector of murein hydrolase